MQPLSRTVPVSRGRLWIGRVLSALPALLLVFSAIMKLLKPPGIEEGFAHLGWPMSLAFALGILELTCALLYAIPRTSVLGAILVTGYLGGAIATHVRIGDPFIIPAVLAFLVWCGLYLREPSLHALIPLKSTPSILT